MLKVATEAQKKNNNKHLFRISSLSFILTLNIVAANK